MAAPFRETPPRNRLQVVTLCSLLSALPPRFVSVRVAGLTSEKSLGGCGGGGGGGGGSRGGEERKGKERRGEQSGAGEVGVSWQTGVVEGRSTFSPD